VGNGLLYTGDPGGVSILLGGPGGTFTKGATYLAGSGPVYTVMAGDFDGDGRLDLAGHSWQVRRAERRDCDLLANGDGTFKAPVTFPTATSPVALAFAI